MVHVLNLSAAFMAKLKCACFGVNCHSLGVVNKRHEEARLPQKVRCWRCEGSVESRVNLQASSTKRLSKFGLQWWQTKHYRVASVPVRQPHLASFPVVPLLWQGNSNWHNYSNSDK